MLVTCKQWWFSRSLKIDAPSIHIFASMDTLPSADIRFVEGGRTHIAPYHPQEQPQTFMFDTAEKCYEWMMKNTISFVKTMDIPYEWFTSFFHSFTGQKRIFHSNWEGFNPLITARQPMLIYVQSMTHRKMLSCMIQQHREHIAQTHDWYALEHRKQGQKVASPHYLKQLDRVEQYSHSRRQNHWILWYPFETIQIVSIK